MSTITHCSDIESACDAFLDMKARQSLVPVGAAGAVVLNDGTNSGTLGLNLLGAVVLSGVVVPSNGQLRGDSFGRRKQLSSLISTTALSRTDSMRKATS